MASRRGTTNRNRRGSSETRRRRRQYLLDTFGDGIEVMCHLEVSDECIMVLDIGTVSVDRIMPGRSGGGYDRGNIQPACLPCQSVQGGRIGRRDM